MSIEIWTTGFSSLPMEHPQRTVDPKAILDDGMLCMEEGQLHGWLSAGTLLGLYRDQRFIPHDTDLDVGVLGYWGHPFDPKMIEALFGSFKLVRTMTYEDHIMQMAFVAQKTIFDIYFFWWNKEENVAINYNDNGVMRKPLSLVAETGDFLFEGTVYPVPWPIEAYLEYRYKDWKTPTDGKRPWFEDAASGLLREQ